MTSATPVSDAKTALSEKSQQSSPCSQVEFCKSDIEVQSTKSGHGHRNWLRRLLAKSSTKSQHAVEVKKDPYLSQVEELNPKTKGYDQLAIFQASDRNFLQYRSFRTLHCRVMSDLQYRVERLESELRRIDKHDRGHSDASKKMLVCKQFDNATSESAISSRQYPTRITRGRPEVLREIKSELLEYDEMLLKTKEVMALQRPTKRDYTSLLNWHQQNQPILQNEALPILCFKEDMITLRDGRESAGLDAFVETCLSRMDRVLQVRLKCNWIQRLFLTQDLRKKNPDGEVKFFSPSRVDILVNIIITAVVFVLLILPVVVMYEVTNIGRGQTPLDAIGVLIVFTLIFGMAVSSLTTARRHELFAASAAYAAVLVVFIGNFGVQQVSILS